VSELVKGLMHLVEEMRRKWDRIGEVEQHVQEFVKWLERCGENLLVRFAERALKNPPSGDWVSAYLEGQLKAAGESWRVIKNIFVAWLVWRGVITVYKANKLAGGAGGYYAWLKRIRELGCE